jgi:hypothetical protein
MNYPLCNGVPVVQELLDFYNAIKLKNPKLQGNPTKRRLLTTLDDDKNKLEVMRSMEIMHMDKPDVVVGRLLCWDKKYYVQSRLIRNEKFAHWNREEYTSRSSINMKTMVKIALDNLIPLTPQEIKSTSNDRTTVFSDISSVSSDIGWKIKKDLKDVSNGMWYEELMYMYDAGYKPHNKEIADAMLLAVAKRKVFEEDFAYIPSVLFVYIEEDNSVTVVNDKDEVFKHDKMEMLPEDVFNKIMVLSVSDELTFIRDVGKKDGTNKFWVLL